MDMAASVVTLACSRYRNTKVSMVPHLTTALNGPLLDFEKKILEATPAIERWFRLEWSQFVRAKIFTAWSGLHTIEVKVHGHFR